MTNRLLRSRWIAAVVLAAVLLSGCGDDSGSSGSRSIGARTLRGLSAFERTTLADKDVTDAELEEAMDRERSCLTAIPGVTYVDVTRKGAVVTSAAEYDESSMQEAQPEVERCKAEVNAVYAVAVLLLGPSEKDRRRSAADLRRCAAAQGIDTPSDATAAEVIAAIAREANSSDGSTGDRLAACVDQYNSAVPSAEPGLAEALADLDI